MGGQDIGYATFIKKSSNDCSIYPKKNPALFSVEKGEPSYCAEKEVSLYSHCKKKRKRCQDGHNTSRGRRRFDVICGEGKGKKEALPYSKEGVTHL